MIDTNEIKARLKQIEDAIEAKGYPHYSVMLTIGGSAVLMLRWGDANCPYLFEDCAGKKHFEGPSIDDLMNAALGFVDLLRTPEDRERSNAVVALEQAISNIKRLNIDPNSVDPSLLQDLRGHRDGHPDTF